MADTPPAPGELAELRAANTELRAANARLRELLAAKDAQIEVLTGQLEELRAQVADLAAGKLAWVHSASAGKFELVTVHPKRGKEGMDAAGLLPAFTGIACHDAWKPYDS